MTVTFDTPTCSEECPGLLKQSLDVISSKWAAPLLVHLQLSDRACGFAELRRELAGVSPKELTKTLRTLEANNIVARRVTPVVPPRVNYELTDHGRGLKPALEALATWRVKGLQDPEPPRPS